MTVPSVIVTPALSLDADLISDNPDRKTIYESVFSGSRISQIEPWSTWRLFSAEDILRERALVGEFFCRLSGPGTLDTPTLLGGYVFHHDQKYLFGGEFVYAFHQEWDWALKAILRTTPVEFVIENSRYKFIRNEEQLVILHPGGEIRTEYLPFAQVAARALEDNRKLKQALSEELFSRGMGRDSDLIVQLLGETSK